MSTVYVCPDRDIECSRIPAPHWCAACPQRASAVPSVANGAAELPPLPNGLELIFPDLHPQALGCGVEDRGIHDRYDAAQYGWQDGMDRAIGCIPDPIFDANQMRDYARAAIAASAPNAALVEALKGALAVIEDYLEYDHDGDPWKEDARTMGEMDINDYQRDGRLESARAALSSAGPATPQPDIERDAVVKRKARNQVCIDGHLNAALDDIMRSNSPDGTFNILGALVDNAIDAAMAAQQNEKG